VKNVVDFRLGFAYPSITPASKPGHRKERKMWNTIKTPAELDEYFATMAKLDAHHAKESLNWWLKQSPAQLDALAAGAWTANDAETFMLAKSFRATYAAA
jgi:hypothetical protein